MQVYGDAWSGNCLKVKWLLDALGHEYEWIPMDLLAGATRTPEFLALNPAGQVPLVILEGGRPLAQSNAILLYFGEGSRFVPGGAYARARMLEWLFWEQYSHEPYVAVRRWQVSVLGRPDAEIDPKLLERGNVALARLDGALAGSDFLVGDGATLADVALIAYTRVAHEGGFDLDAFPRLRPWIARTEAAFGVV